MKKYITLCTIIMILASCNSNKTTDKTNDGSISDTITNKSPDSTVVINADNNPPVSTDLEYIGELRLGQGQKTVVDKLGEPESRSKIEEWGADGLLHQDWKYTTKGITLNMNGEKENGEMTVFSITITSPCDLKTKKNIGIGSIYNDVMAAYEKEIDKESSDKNVITVGSLYGGLIIEFKNEKAVKIFAGAAAE